MCSALTATVAALEGELPSPAGEPAEVVWPLDADVLEDLRWYLEDYLRAPFGVYGERGPRVASQLTGWGRAVFTAVFGAGPARDAYVRMRSRTGARVEIVFPVFRTGLAGAALGAVVRSGPPDAGGAGSGRAEPQPASGRSAQAFGVGGERLRVLMVISRPAGAADVGYRMIARPLLERLEAVRGSVELLVLRPRHSKHWRRCCRTAGRQANRSRWFISTATGCSTAGQVRPGPVHR